MALTGIVNRKYLSDVIAEHKETGMADWSYARVTVKTASGSGSVAVDPIGQALIYAGAAGEFVVMEDTDTIPVTGDVTLTGAPKVAILAGDAYGSGFNESDLTITEAGVVATVFIGHGVVVEDGVVFDTISADGAMAAEKTAFFNQLRQQEVRVKDAAQTVSPSYNQA